MQIEKELIKFDPKTLEEIKSTYFEAPQAYDQKQMFEAMEDPTVKEVHVFKGNPENIKWAELRQKYPNKNRAQLRKMMKELK